MAVMKRKWKRESETVGYMGQFLQDGQNTKRQIHKYKVKYKDDVKYTNSLWPIKGVELHFFGVELHFLPLNFTFLLLNFNFLKLNFTFLPLNFTS